MKGYVTIQEGAVERPRSLRPAVSVIVPCYNTEATLDQALTSLEDQTLENLEVLVVNDGSTDGTLAIARAHAARDPRIRVIDKPNGGYGQACNRGLDEAQGTWVAILEPDDWVLPDMYRAMTSFAKGLRRPVDIVETPYWRILNPDTPQQQRLNCSYRGRVRPKSQPFPIGEAPHLLRHHPSIWSAIYRRDFLNDRGIRFPEYPGAGWADNPFLVETLCQTHAIAYLDEPFYCYREETPEDHHAFVVRNRTMALDRWQAMMDVIDRLQVTDPVVLRSMVRRGFTYLGGIVDEIGWDDEVREAAQAMYERMDPQLVMTEPDLAPMWKQRFAEARGLEGQGASKLPYAASLVRDGLYTLRNNGLGYTLKMAGTLGKHR